MAFARNIVTNGYPHLAYSPQANTADLKAALAQAEGLLSRNPRLAAQQAEEILVVHPGSEAAQRILAAACRLQGDAARSLALLEPLARRNTDSPGFLYEYGQSLGALGRGDEAIAALRRAVRLEPRHAAAWRALGDHLAVAGDETGSHDAYENHFAAAIRHPQLIECVESIGAREFVKPLPSSSGAGPRRPRRPSRCSGPSRSGCRDARACSRTG